MRTLEELVVYFKNPKVFKQLEKEEELEIAYLMEEARKEEATLEVKNASMNARNFLIESNMSFVEYVAQSLFKLDPHGKEYDDCVSAGYSGLIAASDKYRMEYNTRFTTCAAPSIKKEISEHLRGCSRVLSIPRNVVDDNKDIEEFRNQYFLSNGTYPDVELLMEVFDYKKERVLKALNANNPVESLDYTVDDEGNKTLGDCISDNGLTPDQLFYNQMALEFADKKMESFTDLERFCLQNIFASSDEQKTQAEMAKIMNMPRTSYQYFEKKLYEELVGDVRNKMGME